MRSFTGDEPFEPVAGLPPAPGTDAPGEPLSRMRPKDRRLGPLGGRIVMGGGSIVLILFAWQSFNSDGVLTALVVGTFALLWTAGFVLTEVRARQDRKVAALMRAQPALAASNQARRVAAAERGVACSAPPLRLDVYLQSELQALPGRYLTPVGAELNIIGLPPRRILYLYNFFSPETLLRKVKGSWRRFGPVYYLGNPGDISFEHTFDPAIGDKVASAILATPEAFDARFAQANDDVLPPGNPTLKDVSHLSGGYGQHLFLCSDGSWRHGVGRLFDRADVVLLDASEYDEARAGLNWEIGQLVDRVAMRNVVVLIDERTDQVALCAAFRAAWSAMEDRSPNNRPDAGSVRWVMLQSPREQESGPPPALAPEADPCGLYAGLNFLQKALVTAHYRDALADDRIFGLFLQPSDG